MMQKRFTMILLGPEGLNYKGRLDRLGALFPGGYTIEVDAIMRGIDEVNGRRLFPRVGRFKTRFKVRGETFYRDLMGN